MTLSLLNEMGGHVAVCQLAIMLGKIIMLSLKKKTNSHPVKHVSLSKLFYTQIYTKKKLHNHCLSKLSGVGGDAFLKARGSKQAPPNAA